MFSQDDKDGKTVFTEPPSSQHLPLPTFTFWSVAVVLTITILLIVLVFLFALHLCFDEHFCQSTQHNQQHAESSSVSELLTSRRSSTTSSEAAMESSKSHHNTPEPSAPPKDVVFDSTAEDSQLLSYAHFRDRIQSLNLQNCNNECILQVGLNTEMLEQTVARNEMV